MSVIELNPPKVGDLHPGTMLLFLAGPLRGASNWQDEALREMRKLEHPDSQGEIYVANPRGGEAIRSRFDYKRTARWKELHLIRAAKMGEVMFWLAKQDPTALREVSRDYDQATRTDFDQVLGWKQDRPEVSMTVGIESGFGGDEAYYRQRAEAFDITVADSLDALCLESMIQLFRAERIDF